MFELSDRELEELWPGLERLLNNTGRPWDALDVTAAKFRRLIGAKNGPEGASSSLRPGKPQNDATLETRVAAERF